MKIDDFMHSLAFRQLLPGDTILLPTRQALVVVLLELFLVAMIGILAICSAQT